MANGIYLDPKDGKYRVHSESAPFSQPSPSSISSATPQTSQPSAPQQFDITNVIQAISNIANDISNLPDKNNLRSLQESQLGPDQLFAKQDFVSKYLDEASIGKRQAQMWDQALGVFDPHIEMDWIGQANKLQQALGKPGNMFDPQAVGDANSIYSSSFQGNPDTSTSLGRDQMRAQTYALGLLENHHALLQNQRNVEDFLLGDGFMDYVENVRKQYGDKEAEGYFQLGQMMLDATMKGLFITPQEAQSTLDGRQAFVDKYNPMQWDPMTGKYDRDNALDYGLIYNKRTAAHLSVLAQRQVEDNAFAKQASIMGLGFENMPEIAKFSPQEAEGYALKTLSTIGAPPAKDASVQQAMGNQELKAISDMGNAQFNLINKDNVASLADKVKAEEGLAGELVKGQSGKDILSNELGVPTTLHPDYVDNGQQIAASTPNMEAQAGGSDNE